MSKISKIIFLTILLLIEGSFLYKFLPDRSDNKPKESLPPVVNDSTEIPNPTSSDQETNFPEELDSYYSKKYDLEISYPKGWYLRDDENNKPNGSYGGSLYISSIPNDNNFPGLNKEIFSMEMGDMQTKYDSSPIEEWVKKFNSGLVQEIPEPKSSEKIIIDGKEALIRISSSIFGDVYEVYMPYGDSVLGIGGPLVDSKYGNYFIKILKSIKFHPRVIKLTPQPLSEWFDDFSKTSTSSVLNRKIREGIAFEITGIPKPNESRSIQKDSSLIYWSNDTTNNEININAIDLNSGEKYEIYNGHKSYPNRYIASENQGGDFYIIDGELYFIETRYSLDLILSIDLSSKVSKEISIINSKRGIVGMNEIELKENGSRILITGDNRYFCSNTKYFYLFNPVNKTIRKIMDSTTGCYEGNEYLGIYHDKYFIFSNREPLEFGMEFPGSVSLYKNIQMFNLDNLNEEAGAILLNEKDMPQNIRKMNFVNSENIIEMYDDLGNKYQFDIENRLLKNPSVILYPKASDAESKFPGGTATYHSEKYKLTISYPKNYYFHHNDGIDSNGGTIEISNYNLGVMDYGFALKNQDKIFKLEIINYSAYYGTSSNLEDWVNSYNKITTQEFEDTYRVESMEKITIDNKDMILQKTSGFYTVFMNINNDIIGMTGYPGGDKFKDLYFNIINSIKFDK